MNKIFWSLVVCFAVCLGVFAAAQKSLTFEEGIKQSKPMALFLYADWADGVADGLTSFSKMKSKYSGKYNFITLNIASNDAKAFNKMYYIYPNLPYVLLFRDGTKFSRFLNSDCVKSPSCFSDKLDTFVN